MESEDDSDMNDEQKNTPPSKLKHVIQPSINENPSYKGEEWPLLLKVRNKS